MVCGVKVNPRTVFLDQGGSNQGFPILDELDEQITKLNNELQVC
jgi:hypothetical protein